MSGQSTTSRDCLKKQEFPPEPSLTCICVNAQQVGSGWPFDGNLRREYHRLNYFTVRALSFSRRFSSTAEAIRRLKETAFLRGPIQKLGEVEREQSWTEIERQLSQLEGPNGVEVPGEFLIGVGTK